ncbi:MAG: tetratricopeptide repeat protein, partial [Gammaproteobacteria bacterium]|nr:tetratricopeptide repeat protein [Gammaproteobacteria bacterium]
FANAEATLEEVKRLAPNLTVARHALGTVYQEVGKYDLAAGEFEEAVRQEPENIELLIRAGVSFFHAYKGVRAEEYFLRAIKCDPTCIDAVLNLSDFYLSCGRDEAATLVLQQATVHSPNEYRLTSALMQLTDKAS